MLESMLAERSFLLFIADNRLPEQIDKKNLRMSALQLEQMMDAQDIVFYTINIIYFRFLI